MERLYYIENQGCDATTYGLVRISDEDFPKFETFVKNLNRNSWYGCMPKIHVWEIDEARIRPLTEDDCEDNRLYLDDGVYVVDREWYWDVYDKPLILGSNYD